METLIPFVLTSGWASGINAYAVVAVLGIAGRLSDAVAVPDPLQQWWVIALAGAMFLVEGVLDKIAFVDSVWDAVSTVVRPVVGGLVGYQIAGDAAVADPGLYAALGGGSALAAHVVKTATRLAVNGSPEPVSNVVVSAGEDVTVVGVVLLALQHPWWAFGIAATCFVVGGVVVALLFRLVRRGWQRRRARGTVGVAR